jgi:futalosine hydrolase
MNILVIASAEKEVKFVLEQEVAVFVPTEQVYNFKRNGHLVDFLITGPGMVMATYWTSRILSQKKYDVAVHVGLAGSYRKQIRIGTVVQIVSDCFADMGYYHEGNFITFFAAGQIDKNSYPFREEKLISQYDLSGFRLIKTLPTVNAITVSHNTTDSHSITQKIAQFNPDIETLDSAAVLFSCYMHHLPCIALRAVSHHVESFSLKNWQLPETIFSLGKHLYFLLHELMNNHRD